MLPGPRHRELTTMRTKATYSLDWELWMEQESFDNPRQVCINSVPGQRSLYTVVHHTLHFKNTLLQKHNFLRCFLYIDLWLSGRKEHFQLQLRETFQRNFVMQPVYRNLLPLDTHWFPSLNPGQEEHGTAGSQFYLKFTKKWILTFTTKQLGILFSTNRFQSIC